MPQNTNAVKIALPAPKTVVAAKVVSEVTLARIVDLPGQRVVRAFVNELPNPIALWEGDEYDAIGDWTQAQAEARLLAKLA